MLRGCSITSDRFGPRPFGGQPGNLVHQPEAVFEVFFDYKVWVTSAVSDKQPGFLPLPDWSISLSVHFKKRGDFRIYTSLSLTTSQTR